MSNFTAVCARKLAIVHCYGDDTNLDPLDSDQNGALVTADIVHLSLPDLAKVALS